MSPSTYCPTSVRPHLAVQMEALGAEVNALAAEIAAVTGQRVGVGPGQGDAILPET